MRSKPKLEVHSRRFTNLTIFNYVCVEECKSGYIEIFNRCYFTNSSLPDDFDLSEFEHEAVHDLIMSWPQILLICLLSGFLSFLILLAFRFGNVELTIYNVCFLLPTIVLIIAVIFLIFLQIFAGIVFAIMGIIPLIVFCCYRSRIKLIAMLFKETSKALIDIPGILFEPFLTFIFQMIAISLCLFLSIVINTAGDATLMENPDNTTFVAYKPNPGVVMAKITNGIAFIWFSFFIAGCQIFIVGGTISKWYFARDKSTLKSPISRTFKHLLRFHLG